MDYAQYAVSDSNFLKANDLNDEKAILTIIGSEIDESEFRGEKRSQVVVSFEETEKKLGLNKTNLRAIIALYGTDGDEWVGKSVTLFPTFVNDPQGKQVETIRIEPKPPKATAEKGLAASI